MTTDDDIQYLDRLIQICGCFTLEHDNGYGCTHTEQHETDTAQRGSCFAHSCPVACRLDPPNEPLDVEMLRSRGWSDTEIAGVSQESNLMFVHDRDLLFQIRTP